MKVSFKGNVAEYLRNKGYNSLTVEINQCNTCCGNVRQPVVEPGSPTTKFVNFNEYEVDGIKVFVSSEIKVKEDELIIKKGRVLFSEYLTPVNIDTLS